MLTGFPCAERDLGEPAGVWLSTGIHTGGKLSTGCVHDLWKSELITPEVPSGRKNSRLKARPHPLSGGKGSLQKMNQRKRVDEG